jgi:NAD(P)-dependent dehydrogenase (short-subunit alcohol dehydrogenase family)
MLPRMAAAVVTGAARGLGLEIARGLAARGLDAHLTDVDLAAAEEAAAQIGGGAWASELDVRDAEACRVAAAATAERAGSLDVWVNNAGILKTGVTWEQDEELRRAMMDINAHGTFNGTLAALELMRPAGRGHIINIVSLAGLVAAPGETLYAASKHAAIAFTIGTLSDLRRSGIEGIELSAVCPDGIWTAMLEDKLDDPDAALSFSGHFMSPPEVAKHVVSLLDKPRVVMAIPRRRGAFVRLVDAFPGATLRALPFVMADARRKQKRWKQRIERGERP